MALLELGVKSSSVLLLLPPELGAESGQEVVGHEVPALPPSVLQLDIQSWAGIIQAFVGSTVRPSLKSLFLNYSLSPYGQSLESGKGVYISVGPHSPVTWVPRAELQASPLTLGFSRRREIVDLVAMTALRENSPFLGPILSLILMPLTGVYSIKWDDT